MITWTSWPNNNNNINSLLRSETLNLFQNNYVNSLSLLFKLSVQFKSRACPCELIKFLLFNAFFKISLHVFCCSWSEVCLVLAFPPHPFAYFLMFGYLLWTPDNSNPTNSNFFLISVDGSSYQELTVVHFLSNDKKYNFFLRMLRFQHFSWKCCINVHIGLRKDIHNRWNWQRWPFGRRIWSYLESC